MKKILSLSLALLLFLLALPALGENVIINKINGQNADFSFPEDAQLLEVYFPKIYGCDAAYVRYGDYSMLIDCGGNQWESVRDLLRKLGVTDVTYAVNSHPDADHLGGFNHVLKEMPAGEFLLGFPENYDEGDTIRFKVYADLHDLNIPFRQVQDGEKLEFGDVQVTVHQRTDASLTRVNNKSVMLMIQLGERRIFFTGDIQRDAQLLLIEDAAQLDLKADILKFPHHGYNRMQVGFLDMVDPELVIITSGRSSAGGAEQLKERQIQHLFCEGGAIRLATDGTVWTVERLN